MTVLAWFFFIGMLPVFVAEILTTTIYLHRHLTHGSVVWMAPPLRFAFRFCAWLAGVVPREWVAVHRKHHELADKPGDPHSPKIFGYMRVLFGNAGLYRREAKNPETVVKYAPQLMRSDWWDRHVFNRSVLGPSVGLPLIQFGVAWWAIGVDSWLEALLLAALMTAGTGLLIWAYLLAGGLVNAMTHRAKEPNIHGDYSSNNVFVAIYTSGEGLHANHHLKPDRANFGLKWWQFDPAYWTVIFPSRCLGLMRVKPMK